MSRPLRIEYPDAWYHVMNRGRRSEKIFSDGHDYGLFIDLLVEISELWRVNIAAYCLMENNYHILLQTPEGNLARCMRHLNGVYTQRFNRRHGYDGQLFRGRYKSILIADDNHLLQVARYIHKNPIRANLAKNLSEYPWSSYNGYLSRAKKWHWLYKDFILNMISPQKQRRLKNFITFMHEDDSAEIATLYSRKNLPSIFGPDSFISRIKAKFHHTKTNYEIPESKYLAPDSKAIIKAVCKYYSVSLDNLFVSRRGVVNQPRNIAIYLLRRMRRDTLIKIKETFKLNTYSTVSSIVQKTEKSLETDKTLRKDVLLLQKIILKGKP